MISIYFIAKADFLQRVRSYGFLITLGICAFISFSMVSSPGSDMSPLALGSYRGLNNCAWIGCLIAIVCGIYLMLAGFYLVNNSIKRDRDTEVG